MVSFVCLTCGNRGGCDSKHVTLTKEQKHSGKTLRSDVIVLEEHMGVLLFSSSSSSSSSLFWQLRHLVGSLPFAII